MSLRRLLPVRPRFRYHAAFGRTSGYPRCCIAWFCAFAWMPDRAFEAGLWRWLRVPDGRGYIPCPLHYREESHG